MPARKLPGRRTPERARLSAKCPADWLMIPGLATPAGVPFLCCARCVRPKVRNGFAIGNALSCIATKSPLSGKVLQLGRRLAPNQISLVC